jgi:hypothetical protein
VAAKVAVGSASSAAGAAGKAAVTLANVAGKSAKAAAAATASTVVASAAVAKRSAVTVATTVLDQNGDGQLSQEDLKILTEKGLAAAKTVASEVGAVVQQAAKSDLVKETAGAAIVGAAIALPLPIVGPATGAVVGAALGAYSHLVNKKR